MIQGTRACTRRPEGSPLMLRPAMADGTASPPTPSRYSWKRLAIELSVGLVLGFAGWLLVGPGIISLWYKAPSGGLSCGPSVQDALQQFVTMELWSALAGALGFVALLFGARRIFKSRSTQPGGS